MSDALGGLFGMIGDIVSGNQQANAVQGAANTSADAMRYAANQQVNYLTQGANQAAGYLDPIVEQGNIPTEMVLGAVGAGGQNQGAYEQAYNDAYNNSHWRTEADFNTDQAYQQLQSTNAAMGKGGAINSGKALRAAGEMGYQLAMQGRDAHLGNLKEFINRGDTARTNMANVRIGQAGQVANAFGQLGQGLAQNAQWQGANLANIAQQTGANMSGWGGYFGNMAGNYFNNNGQGRGIQNATGTGLKPSNYQAPKVTTKNVFAGGKY